MLTSPSLPSSSHNASSTSPRLRSRADSQAPFCIETVDLSFIIGVRNIQQLKCLCRRQYPRDPRRATALFATLKDAFEQNKSLPISQIPAIYQPFFTDLRRGTH